MSIQVETYCGGPVETNGYLVIRDSKALIIDAPDGISSWAAEKCKQDNLSVDGLFLTHGHWDHIVDARAIQERFQAPVWIHCDSAPLLEEPAIQSAFNPFYRLRPCKPDRVVASEGQEEFSGFKFHQLLCPGHCPGSLCFYFPDGQLLFGGDVLFAGAVGRWDLPGGSQRDLLQSIERKILVLPDETRVFPGHGPSTTVGEERRTNPYLGHLKAIRR